MHKDPPKFRFIVGTSNKTLDVKYINSKVMPAPFTATTDMSKEMSGILKTFMEIVKKAEKVEYEPTNIRSIS